MKSRDITTEAAERFRLGFDPRDRRLTIPYLTPGGCWHIKRRCTEDHDCKTVGHAKYIYDPGIENHLFNAQTLLDHDNVVIVEGEIDAITCEQYGIPAVGYPGASTWQKSQHWRWCFDSAEEVVVVADGDDPGRKAAQTVAASLRDAVSGDVRIVDMPDGCDSNSFLSTFGEQEFLYLLEWI